MSPAHEPLWTGQKRNKMSDKQDSREQEKNMKSETNSPVILTETLA